MTHRKGRGPVFKNPTEILWKRNTTSEQGELKNQTENSKLRAKKKTNKRQNAGVI